LAKTVLLIFVTLVAKDLNDSDSKLDKNNSNLFLRLIANNLGVKQLDLLVNEDRTLVLDVGEDYYVLSFTLHKF
jgi:hypothetical protein